MHFIVLVFHIFWNSLEKTSHFFQKKRKIYLIDHYNINERGM